MSISIRAISPDQDLVSICKQMQPELWDKANDMSSYQPELLKNFLEKDGVLILAYDGDTVAGAALCYELPHPGGEHSLYVHELDTHPSYRRQGIATKVMEEVFAVARERELKEVWLGTETDNDPANGLYKSLKPYEIEPSITYSYKVD